MANTKCAFRWISLLSSCITLTFVTLLSGCEGQVPSREEIVTQYPNIDSGSLREENIQVLCPFVRMLERAGLFDNRPSLTIPASRVTVAAQEFGCSALACGPVASAVSISQRVGGVDIRRLHEAPPISHECGLTFAFGGSQVDNAVRQATLDRLLELSDENGQLSFDDIRTVKLEICASQGVNITTEGNIEIQLIYAYLGGVENGFVLHSDVEKLLHAEMPATKTRSWVNASLLRRIN